MIQRSDTFMINIVTYYRVSTTRQGQSGLGLAAQKQSVSGYLLRREYNIIDEVIEVESGNKADRPKLMAAIELCKATHATLLVAKIDRLTRDATFLLSLRDSGVDFVAADMPDANRMTVGIMALIAEQEREAISQRTKDALAAAKRRGVVLGAFSKADKTKFVGRVGTRADALAANTARAEKFRRRSIERITSLHHFDPSGVMSTRQLAKVFNLHNIPTVSGRGSWSSASILKLRNLANDLNKTASDEQAL